VGKTVFELSYPLGSMFRSPDRDGLRRKPHRGSAAPGANRECETGGRPRGKDGKGGADTGDRSGGICPKAATSTVVTKDDIDLGPYQNLPGYLEEPTGIDMAQGSLLGVKAHQLSLRGFDESRYQVYLNGRSWKGAGVKGGY
jgi:hypothetical protein